MDYDEVWTEVDGTNGDYYVSSYGRVFARSRLVRFGDQWRHTKSHVLAPRPHTGGYLTVQIHGKDRFIHRLVATAFYDNPDNLPQVNHKDENKQNNRAENLEWCSSSYNVKYGTGRQRCEQTKSRRYYRVMNVDTGEIYDSPMEASRITGIHNDGITHVCNGRHATAGGYHWKYVNETGRSSHRYR